MPLLSNQSPIFMTPGASDGSSVLESSSSAASMGPEMLLEIQPTDRWRSLADPSYVELDMGQAFNVDFVAILFVAATNSATWRVRLATSKANLTAAPSYDSGPLDVYMNKASVDYSSWLRVHSWHVLPSVEQRQFLRVDINDPARHPTPGYSEVGRLYAGKLFQPTLGLQYGSGLPMPHEEVIRLQSEGGLVHPVSRPNPKRAPFSLEFDDEEEFMEGAFELARLRGVSRDVLYVPFPGTTWEHHTATYGLMSEPLQTFVPQLATFALDGDIEEML